MKKHLSPFLSGTLVTALVFSLGLSALAASGQMSFGQFGISLQGLEVVAKGETLAGENGQQVPVVITYGDEAGGSTNYIAVRKITELLGCPIAWDADNGDVAILPGGETTISPGVSLAKGDRLLSAAPIFGVKSGPITEIDPSQFSSGHTGTPIMMETRYQSKFSPGTPRVSLSSEYDNDVIFTFMNNGKQDIVIEITRPYAVGLYGDDFSSVRLAPGKTLERAFHVETGLTTPYYMLGISVRAAYLSDDLKATFEQPVDVTIFANEFK